VNRVDAAADRTRAILVGEAQGMALWDWLFNPSGLTAHGFCLSWTPGLVALHAISDALIGAAYFSIPVTLAWFARRRQDLAYSWAVYLFVAFILACGATHLFSILTLWIPVYGLEGLVKALTALLSIATAAVLWPLVPKLLALPSPAQLRELNNDLERRVGARMAELQGINAQLTEALAERDRSQEALTRSEAEFRASFEGAAVGKTQSDPLTGQLLRVNSAFARMLGYAPEELVHRDGWALTWVEDQRRDRSGYAPLRAGRIPAYVREIRFTRRDGAPIWARISTTIARNPRTREPFMAISVIEDIDAQHKAEDELRVAKRNLENVVRERTAALEQRDLLLREVYHRVKNNLQTVDALLLLQARRIDDPEARQRLTELRGRVYALGLVHQQLMGSDNLKTFDIAPFLEELSANILQSGDYDGVRLTVEASPLDVGLDFAIPMGLLVTELVTNSLKHAFPSGRGDIWVRLGVEPDGQVLLSISDNGRGHDESTGPGLGAGIVRGLVDQLEGAIKVVSDGGLRTEIRTAAPLAA
jgi:PAS domain S-box-containing protein